MPSIAESLNAQPGPDSLAYWLKPFQGFLDRQRKIASEGLSMADQGAQQVRGGDLSGLAGMIFGPMNYLASPINALFPIEEAQTQLPESVSPFVAGGLELMALAAPGPKGKGLGRGVGSLVDDVTDAERAALQQRLAAEAGQTGGAPSAVGRDQALANLTETPKMAFVADDYKMAHRPPSEKYGARLDDLTQMFPEDIYGDAKLAARYYGHGLGELDRRAVKIAQQFRGKPDAEVTIYRAVPKGTAKDIGAGDWVTLDRDYAAHHGDGPLGGDYDIIERKVKVAELFTSPDSIHEFGWHPK
jgi:hypothetical protein